MSPSMDILISSNLERLLYLLYKNSDKIIELMKKLDQDKVYKLDKNAMDIIQNSFKAYWTSEEETVATIKEVFNKEKELVDPHTAVAIHAVNQYKNETEDNSQTVILSTASPYKFTADVLKAINGECIVNPFEAMRRLEQVSDKPVPENLKILEQLPIRFDRSINIEEGMGVIRKRLEDINHAYKN